MNKEKVQIRVFYRRKLTQLGLVITLAWFFRNSPTKDYSQGNFILYNFDVGPKIKKCTIWEIWTKTLQVLLKFNKNTFGVKAHNLSMEASIEMKQKVSFRGHYGI